LQLILVPDPSQRISAEDILQHPYILQPTCSTKSNRFNRKPSAKYTVSLSENISLLEDFQKERLSSSYALLVSTRLLTFHKTNRYEQEKTLVYFKTSDYTKQYPVNLSEKSSNIDHGNATGSGPQFHKFFMSSR
jgi:hypothetical protein